MANFQVKRWWRRLLYSKFSAAVLLLLAAWFGQAAWKVFWRGRAVGRERAAAAAQLAELTGRREALEAQIARLETDRGVEAAIRQKFSVIRPGERVIVVVDQKATVTAATSTASWFGWLEKLFP